ncbi:MAG: domain containing protein [Fibrobacteres bacterium]|nr:domain containing protein [Fibrobacterota bacterium]
MKSAGKGFWFGSGMALALAAGVSAAPIRVVIFNTCGPSSFVHPIAQQTPLLKTMFKDPAAANLQFPLIPSEGFTVDSVGVATNGTTADGHNLILALPTHDVVICANNTDFSKLFTTTDQLAFQAWIAKKGHGVVAFHGASDDNGIWLWKMSFFGAKFNGHSSGKASVLADSTPKNVSDPDFQMINAGLTKLTTVDDEWYSFQANPRDLPGLHVLSTLDEGTYTVGNKMGDHPISWFRAPPDSGRFYYTGAGHDWKYFKDTYWLRRQVYNAVLWASGYVPPVIAVEAKPVAGQSDFSSQGTRSSLTIRINRDGKHTVQVRGLDGRGVAMEKGVGMREYTFGNLEPNSVYAVLVTANGKTSRSLVKLR